jgi:hypothetical protein
MQMALFRVIISFSYTLKFVVKMGVAEFSELFMKLHAITPQQLTV